MKRQILAVTAILALTGSALAVPQLRLSDGTTTITVVDGDANDKELDPGAVTFIGTVGPHWNISNVATGATKPLLGSPSEPFMDMEASCFSTSAGDLIVQFTD